MRVPTLRGSFPPQRRCDDTGADTASQGSLRWGNKGNSAVGELGERVTASRTDVLWRADLLQVTRISSASDFTSSDVTRREIRHQTRRRSEAHLHYATT